MHQLKLINYKIKYLSKFLPTLHRKQVDDNKKLKTPVRK